jgi:HPt (histidine-containing phosphotransfer) domain-containing protein
MDSNFTLINFDFGTRQLSGNLDLYKKLLGRFATEYQHASEKLAEFAQLNNLEEMQLLVHTIKGVSGNLGLDQLHHTAGSLDSLLKTGVIEPTLLSDLGETIAATRTEIELQCNTSTADQANVGQSDVSKQQLIEELQKQRFISDDRLSEFVNASDLPDNQQQELKSCIDQLDYAAALEILENH